MSHIQKYAKYLIITVFCSALFLIAPSKSEAILQGLWYCNGGPNATPVVHVDWDAVTPAPFWRFHRDFNLLGTPTNLFYVDNGPSLNTTHRYDINPDTRIQPQQTVWVSVGNCQATINVNSNLSTSWSISGIGSGSGTSGSYGTRPSGTVSGGGGTTYSINAPNIPGYTLQITTSDSSGAPSSALVLSPGQSKTFYLTYVSSQVITDLQVNGSDGPVAVSPGQSVSLSWTSQNASSCSASASPSHSAWSGSKPTNSPGTSVGPINQTTTFTINCANGSANDSDSVTVYVPSVSLWTGNIPGNKSTTIFVGTTGSVNWTSSGATSCSASSNSNYQTTWNNRTWSGGKPLSGVEAIGQPTALFPTTITITCTQGSASVSDTVNFFPAPAPVVSPSTPTGLATITSTSCGGKIDVSWNASSGATSYELQRDGSTIVYTGAGLTFTDTVPVGSSHSYQVRARNSAGASAWSGSVSAASSAACAGPTVSISANPPTVASGGASTLSWTSSGATSCTASASPANSNWTGAKALNGSQSTGPLTATTMFTLTCSNAGGSSSDSTTVSVNNASTISVTSNNASASWVVSPGNLSGSGMSGGPYNITPNAGGSVYTIGSIPNLPGYNYTVTNSDGGGASMTVFPGENKSFSINYAASGGSFDYSLTGPASITIPRGSAATYNLDKNLVSGTSEPVRTTTTTWPGGVGISLSYTNRTCSPDCTTGLQISVAPSTPIGSYNVVTTNTPQTTGSPVKTHPFTINVTSGGAAALSVTCSANPSPAEVGNAVTWTANVAGGTAPYTYAWSGTDIVGTPSTNPFVISYSTTGAKSASVTVTDALGQQASCPATNVQVNIDPDFREI